MKKVIKSKAFLAFCIGFFLYILLCIPEIMRYDGIVLHHSDYIFQRIPFTFRAYDAVKAGDTLWDWSSGLGSGFVTSFISPVFSPMSWIILLFPRDILIYALPFAAAVKFGFGTLFAYFYISRFVNDRNLAVIGGIVYMFSTYTAYNEVFDFTERVAFFPLLLIALEELCVNKRRGWFAVMVTVMAVLDIYFLFGQAVFCVIYYFVRCTDSSFGRSLKQFFSVAFEAVIGVLLSMALILPYIMLVFDQPRATETMQISEMFVYHDIFHYLKIIQSAFMIPDPMGFTSLFEETEATYPYGTLQSSTAAFLPFFGASGVISWVWAKRKSWQSKLLIIFPIMALVPVLNSAFSAFNSAYYARWFYMPLLLAAVVSVKALEEEISFKPGIIINGSFLLFFLLYHFFLTPLGTAFAYGEQYYMTQFFDAKRVFSLIGSYIIQLIMIPVFSLIMVLWLSKKRREEKFIPKAYAAVLICTFMTFNSYSYYYISATSTFEYAPYILDRFKNGFRVDADLSTEGRIMTNGANAYGNMFLPSGLDNLQRAFSIYDPGNIQFLEATGYKIGRMYDYFNYIEGREPADLASVKYVVTLGLPMSLYSKIGMVTEEDVQLSSEEFDEKYRLGEITVLNDLFYIQENLNYIPMGFTYDKMVSHDRFMQIDDYSQRRKLMLKAIIVEDTAPFADILINADAEAGDAISDEEYQELIEARRSECSSSLEKTTEGLTAQITLEKENLVFFSASYNDCWTAYVDGEKTDCYNVNEGMIGVRVPAGTHTVKLEYHYRWFDEGYIISGAAAAVFAAYLIIFRKKKNAE